MTLLKISIGSYYQIFHTKNSFPAIARNAQQDYIDMI